MTVTADDYTASPEEIQKLKVLLNDLLDNYDITSTTQNFDYTDELDGIQIRKVPTGTGTLTIKWRRKDEGDVETADCQE